MQEKVSTFQRLVVDTALFWVPIVDFNCIPLVAFSCAENAHYAPRAEAA